MDRSIAEKSRREMEAEDVISKQIRDKALKTWQLGKNLGISGSVNDAAIIDILVELDVKGNKQIVVDKENRQSISQ